MKQTELDQIQLPLNMAEEIICAVPRANRLRRGREILGQMTAISNVVLSKRISYPENSTRHSLTHSLKVPDRGSRFSVIFPSKVAFLSSLPARIGGSKPHRRRCSGSIFGREIGHFEWRWEKESNHLKSSSPFTCPIPSLRVSK